MRWLKALQNLPVNYLQQAFMTQTLYDKLYAAHLVHNMDDGRGLLYIDRQLLHEVTSPQAFEGLRVRGLVPWRVGANVATADHSIPTRNHAQGYAAIHDPIARIQVESLDANCLQFGIPLFGMGHDLQGIVHVIGPELGLTLPGMTIVCGDSHTSTHGALAALSQGIGTSDVEHVLATQCLVQAKFGNMRAVFHGTLPKGVYPKDCILALIARIGTGGATKMALEYSGPVVDAMSMEGRMTLCNMSIEAGAKFGLIGFDATTEAYIAKAPFAPQGAAWDTALAYWRTLSSDDDAYYDKQVEVDCNQLAPQVSWGTSPEMVVGVDERVPNPQDIDDKTTKESYSNALDYMGLQPGMTIESIGVDRVFIGSCTNARLEDLRQAAAIIQNRKRASSVKEAIVVPGSGSVKRAAEAEGLDEVFRAAGFEWREPGCSMCLGMNDDTLKAGEHCASTSNRNFEGRQGAGGRTHLVSPAMAAAAALAGHFVDIRKELN